MSEYKGIMICGEITGEKLASITKELLGCGRRFATELNEEVSCLLIGNQLGDASRQAISYGADRVYTFDGPEVKDYQTESYLMVMQETVKEHSPRILLFGQTSLGRDLAPRLAFRLGGSASMDCLELNINPSSKLLEQTRSVYGGKARAVFISEAIPQIATVRQKSMSPLEPDETRKGEIIAVKVDLEQATIRTKVVDTVKEEIAGIRLEDARVIVSGGRGIGDKECFLRLEGLAKLLKGALGASRPACDSGWAPETIQVGLTGKIVSPEIYIAIGISGASQHLTGCSGCRNIVAINKDPEANIFREARFGVVGDWKQVLPSFQERISQLLAG